MRTFLILVLFAMGLIYPLTRGSRIGLEGNEQANRRMQKIRETKILAFVCIGTPVLLLFLLLNYADESSFGYAILYAFCLSALLPISYILKIVGVR